MRAATLTFIALAASSVSGAPVPPIGGLQDLASSAVKARYIPPTPRDDEGYRRMKWLQEHKRVDYLWESEIEELARLKENYRKGERMVTPPTCLEVS